MVNAAGFRSQCSVLLLAALVLTAAAWLRGAEYDEQYTLFLTAGTPRPDWPETVFPAGAVAAAQAGHATLAGIARDLRATDVHPPLYFWAISVWRSVFGPGLFATRMLSVLCGVVSLGLVGMIARRCAIRPAVAMLITLGCYGFVYTNAIARGFAPAQMLTLCGVVLLFGRRPLLAGACLGAACCCNYLAVFIGVAAVAVTGAWPAVAAAAPFLALDAWFFAAQHAARPGQFPAFEVWPSLLRLTEYQVASVFGGLPLYVDGNARMAVGAGVGLASVLLAGCVALVRPLASGPGVRVLLAAAVAPPVGLLALGAVFDNTPIELRYLSFGVPFIGLLAAMSVSPRYYRASILCDGRAWLGRQSFAIVGNAKTWVAGPSPAMTHRENVAMTRLLPLILTIQLAGIFGLLFAPRTMQPARAATTEAGRLAGDGIVVLPAGNDGVGIVGAFGIEAPPGLPILLIRPTDPIAERMAPFRRVVLAMLAQDRDSTATILSLRAAFSAPNWRRVLIGSNLEVYERIDTGE